MATPGRSYLLGISRRTLNVILAWKMAEKGGAVIRCNQKWARRRLLIMESQRFEDTTTGERINHCRF